MPDARDIHGTVFKNGSAIFLARVVGPTGAVVTQADVASLRYSVNLLDDQDPDQQTPLTGHSGVSLAVSGVIYDALRTDAIWTRDAIGYNFKHVLDVSAHAAFPTAGRTYLSLIHI